EGLEQGISLVTAKAVLGLLDAGVPVGEIVRTGVGFGTRYRQGGWGAGLTVLTAMANVLPHLDPAERPRALVAGLAFVSRDTRGRPPRFPLAPLRGGPPADRLAAWYRRFVETRSADAGREERGAWRYPHDLAGMIAEATARLPERVAAGSACAVRFDAGDGRGVARLAWSILADDPAEVVGAIDDAIVGGARPEEL